MKNIKTVAKRSMGFVLSAVLLAGALTGCGGSAKKEDNLIDQATKGSKDYVFKTDKIDFLEGSDFNNISLVGDKIYASAYAPDGGINISSFNSDGSDLSTIKLPEGDSESHGYMTFDEQGNIYSILNIYSWDSSEGEEIELFGEEGGDAITFDEGAEAAEEEGAIEDDGAQSSESDNGGASEAGEADEADDSEGSNAGIEIIPEEDGEEAIDISEVLGSEDIEIASDEDGMGGYDSSEEEQYLVKYDNTGKEVLRVNLNDKVGEDDYFSVYSMVYVEGTGLLMSSNIGVEKYDEQGNLVSKILDTAAEGNPYSSAAITLYKGFNGTVFASFWGDNGLELRPLDLASGKLGDKSEAFTNFDDYSFFSGNGYDLYVSKSDGFYGYTQSKDSLQKIMDYADSDINMSYSVSAVTAVSDTEFIANLPDEEYNYSLYKLTKVAPEDVKDKTVITLAGNYVDYAVRQKVFKFNQESDQYKIKIVDYSSLVNSDDYQAGANQFNLDIVSGNVPDIMFFTTEEPVDSYINKGLFVDLLPFIKNDPDLANVEFVDNVMNAFKTGDKLYQLVPSFYVETLATKRDYLAGKKTLSIKECEDMIEGKGVSYLNSFGMTDKQSLLYSGLVMSGSQYIDWKTKTCNFNSDEFINFLEFTNKFPDTISDEMWEQYEDTAYMKGDSLFSFSYLNGFRPYRRYVDATFAGDIEFIGFPNNLGTNCSVIVPEMRFAISAQSKNSEAAWQLIRQFLLEDYQNEITYEFPIRKSSYDKLGTDSMERMFWVDDDGQKQYEDDIMYLGDQEVVVKPLTQEEVDYVKEFVGSLDMVYNANENVYNIITEEASAFFSGQKSAKEVADIIQSRVSIYVNENS